ncbi:MAG: porin [Bacteroidales bacterium]|nr:porin [Bacteroidales bacterium]
MSFLLVCFVFVGIAVAQNQTETQQRDFRFRMSSQFSFDAAHYFNLKNGTLDESGDPVMPGGVQLRRLRVGAHADYGDWHSAIVLEAGNGVLGLRDAFAQYSGLENVVFRIGQFKEDFSIEEVTNSRNILFLERAMVVNTFAPARHIGVQAQWHQFDFLRASIGASWHTALSTSDNREIIELREEGYRIGANFTGRVVFMPWMSSGTHGLHIGYGISRRSARRADTYNGANFSSRNATSIDRTSFMATGDIWGVSHDLVHGFELAGFWNGFRIQGELILNNTVMDRSFEPPRLPHEPPFNYQTKRFFGYYIQASHLLFGGSQRYSTSRGAFVAPTRGRSWGDIEVAARFDYLNLNSGEINGGSGHNISFGVTYHMNRHVRMMLNYQIARNDRYANANNPDIVPNARFNVIQARLEVAF